MVTSWTLLKKPDLSMSLNGILAGLVGITAGADKMGPSTAVIIGLVAGALVILSVLQVEKWGLDDPVGAISVHLVCGVWGTLAVGLFGELAGWQQFKNQLIGVAAIGAFSFAFVLLMNIKTAMGLRVSEEEELEGLDIGEHGNEAYPDFQAMTSEMMTEPAPES